MFSKLTKSKWTNRNHVANKNTLNFFKTFLENKIRSWNSIWLNWKTPLNMDYLGADLVTALAGCFKTQLEFFQNWQKRNGQTEIIWRTKLFDFLKFKRFLETKYGHEIQFDWIEKRKIRITLAPIWLPHWPAWMWTSSPKCPETKLRKMTKSWWNQWFFAWNLWKIVPKTRFRIRTLTWNF